MELPLLLLSACSLPLSILNTPPSFNTLSLYPARALRSCTSATPSPSRVYKHSRHRRTSFSLTPPLAGFTAPPPLSLYLFRSLSPFLIPLLPLRGKSILSWLRVKEQQQQSYRLSLSVSLEGAGVCDQMKSQVTTKCFLSCCISCPSLPTEPPN